MLVLLSINVMPFLYVSAGNTQDTDFSYVLNAGDQYKTEARQKLDYSSSYMNCMICSGNYVAAVWGGYVDATAYNCSQGYRYYFATNYKRFMFNEVKERGFPMCQIFAEPNLSGTTASGKWSPDSVYESGVLPATDYIP